MKNILYASALLTGVLSLSSNALADTSSCWADNKKVPINIVSVSNANELQDALSNAVAGTHVELKDGVYTDIPLNISHDGTAENPIVIRAENPGQASLEGNTTSLISGDYVVLSGLNFKNGNITTNLISVSGVNDCISEINIEGYASSSMSRWIMLKWGAENSQIEYSRFNGKSSPGAVIQAAFSIEKNGTINWPRNHIINKNYFSRPPVAIAFKDAGEAIRIGSGNEKDVSGKVLIEQNLFDKSDGELEVISIKASNIMIRNNTFLNSAGQLSFRHGSSSAAIGNYFIVNDTSATYGSGYKRHYSGIHVFGANHFIANNHFEGTFIKGSISSDKEVVVTLQSCDAADPAQGVNLFHNTLIQKSENSYAVDWGNCQSNSLFINNILNAKSSLFLGDINKAPSFNATIAWSEDGETIPPLNGLVTGSDPKFSTDTDLKFEVPTNLNTQAADLPFINPVPGFENDDWTVAKDVVGRNRDTQPDIGDFERNVNTNAVNRPLNSQDVGPSWM